MSCAQTLPVKAKTFNLGSATISCRLLEARRGELYSRIDHLSDTGEIDGAELATRLLVLDSQMAAEQSKKNWTGAVNLITGNALATIGLASCVPTNAGGCLLAVVGKVLAFVGVLEAVGSDADKAKVTGEWRAQVQKIRKDVENKKSAAKLIRDRMIAEFSTACEEVRKNCL